MGVPALLVLARYAVTVGERERRYGSEGFFAAATRAAGPLSFGEVGPYADQRLDGRDSELTCVCSRTGVSIGPWHAYPAAEGHADERGADL